MRFVVEARQPVMRFCTWHRYINDKLFRFRINTMYDGITHISIAEIIEYPDDSESEEEIHWWTIYPSGQMFGHYR